MQICLQIKLFVDISKMESAGANDIINWSLFKCFSQLLIIYASWQRQPYNYACEISYVGSGSFFSLKKG